jgi:hypothetical protein
MWSIGRRDHSDIAKIIPTSPYGAGTDAPEPPDTRHGQGAIFWTRVRLVDRGARKEPDRRAPGVAGALCAFGTVPVLRYSACSGCYVRHKSSVISPTGGGIWSILTMEILAKTDGSQPDR